MKRNPVRTRSLAMILATVAFAAVPVASLAEVPPEAQPTFNKGVLAAKQQDWRLAELSFQEARRSAPDAPELFYELGLTESKMPGRELRAIAWFGAYLAANPKATNAIAVNALIDQLQIKSESNIIQLITTMQKAAVQLPSQEGHPIYVRDDALEGVAIQWEDFGDFDAAQGAIDLIAPVDCCQVKKEAEQDLAKRRAAKANEITTPDSVAKPPSMCDWAVMVDVEAHNNGRWCVGERDSASSFGTELGELSAPVFLDFAGYLSSPPPTGDYAADDLRAPIGALGHSVSKLISVDQEISKMVLSQRTAARQPGKTR